ncbi:MAG: hypothetical protein ACK44A_17120, partial [Roseateles sp.]
MQISDLDQVPPAHRLTAHAPTRGGFFQHHGAWALGVRLFRNLRFATKAWLISLAFLVPLALLAFAFLRSQQATIEFARHELAGAAVIGKLEPWLIEAQRQRRLLLSGLTATLDWTAIEKQQAQVRALVDSLPHGLDLRRELAAVEAQQQALKAQSAGAGADALEAPLQEFVEALRQFRATVLDRSNLTLDPDQDSYYLMSLSTDVLTDVIESISRSRALAGAAARRGATTPRQLHGLYGVWYLGRERVAAITQAASHAGEANADVARRLQPEEAVKAALAFYEASAQSWFQGEFDADVQRLSQPGQAAVDSLRALGKRANELLVERL